ncbi:MAG: hypothetical protein ACI4WM_07800 [Erysipelotrichaceae bacterium]
MDILQILKGIADGSIPNNTQLLSLCPEKYNDLYVRLNRVYFDYRSDSDPYDLVELRQDDIIEMIEEKAYFYTSK